VARKEAARLACDQTLASEGSLREPSLFPASALAKHPMIVSKGGGSY
jgi:hypothetical protein